MIGRIALPTLAAALTLGLSLSTSTGALAQASSTGAAAASAGANGGSAQKAKATPARTGARSSDNRTANRKGQQQVAKAPEPVISDAGPEQLAAAQQVFTGSSQCEFNQTISVEPSLQHSGYLDVRQGKRSWLMKPVMSATGALRLEDVRNEALMIQIGTKSMLLNQKTGQRLVDDCRHPRQMELAAPSTTGMLR